jgi:hypothetical protein
MIRNFASRMILAGVFLALFSIKFVDVTVGEQLLEYPLAIAWEATGIPLTGVSTETWTQLNTRWMPEYELKKTAEQIQRQLQLRPKTSLLSGQQSEFAYVSFEGTRSDGTLVAVTLQSTRNDNLVETQLGVNTVNAGVIPDLRGYIEKLRRSVLPLGRNARFNVALSGERKGKIPVNLMRDFSGKAFRRIKARVIDAAVQDGNMVQKGYTNLIKDAVGYRSSQVNIELNTRYDPARNLTEVIIATPDVSDGV